MGPAGEGTRGASGPCLPVVGEAIPGPHGGLCILATPQTPQRGQHPREGSQGLQGVLRSGSWMEPLQEGGVQPETREMPESPKSSRP